jgi:cobalt-precorrin 5A hydrolase/precorrin-3B C17-methyltransferase
MAEPVVVPILAAQAPLGDRIAAVAGARLDLRGRDFENVADHLAATFRAGHPLIVIGAAGIAIRALAPHLGTKAADAPVLAVAPDGSAVVPLLGGHRGANALAARIGAALGTAPAITTGGEVAFGVALDAPPAGWRLENPEDAKQAMAALIGGASARLSGDAAWLDPVPAERVPAGPDDPVVLAVEGGAALVYRRQDLVLGVGCARGAGPDHVIGFAMRSLAEAGVATGRIAAVHSLDLKADEAAVHALARHLGVPARFHPAAELEAERARMATPSEVVFAETGTHGVAEGAALAAAGPGRAPRAGRAVTSRWSASGRAMPTGAPAKRRGWSRRRKNWWATRSTSTCSVPPRAARRGPTSGWARRRRGAATRWKPLAKGGGWR